MNVRYIDRIYLGIEWYWDGLFQLGSIGYSPVSSAEARADALEIPRETAEDTAAKGVPFGHIPGC